MVTTVSMKSPLNSTSTSVFQVGSWLVKPSLNRVVNSSEQVQIEPKMMKVLVYLAQHPGEVVSRQMLLDEIWKDTVVGDEVVSRVISELRRVLGDSSRPRKIIETIPKSGYRLIAPVKSDQVDVYDRGDGVAPEIERVAPRIEEVVPIRDQTTKEAPTTHIRNAQSRTATKK